VAVLCQIVLAGGIGTFLSLAMGQLMYEGRRVPEGLQIFFLGVVFGGPVIGFLTWFFGLVADRASGYRLATTILCAAGGVFVAGLLYIFLQRSPRGDVSEAVATLAGLVLPIAGAMAGYYWPWRRLRQV
jgi:Na+/H+ antiporter NhaA